MSSETRYRERTEGDYLVFKVLPVSSTETKKGGWGLENKKKTERQQVWCIITDCNCIVIDPRSV